MKRIYAILCCVIISMTVFTPFSVFAFSKTDNTEVELLQAGSFSISDYSAQTLSVTAKTASTVESFIYENLYSHQESFSVQSYGIAVSDFQSIYSNVINDNPELFYVSSSFGYTYIPSSGKIVTITPSYALTQTEIPQAKVIFEKGIQKALRQVDSSMNDAQKALVIHDYIMNLATYPVINNVSTDDRESYHSAYGLFYDGYVVCAGYTLAYSAIMQRLGIDCKYVVSSEMQHAWNSVKIDGYWYNVDLTFDDIHFAQGVNALGTFMHNCFLKSDTAIQSTIGFWHSGIQHYSGVTCTNTKYDSYFWNDVNTNIYVENGDYIYTDYDTNTRNISINRRTVSGNVTKLNTQTIAAFYITLTKSNSDGSQTARVVVPFSKFVKLDSQYFISYIKNLKIYENNNYSGTPVIDSFDIYSKEMYNLLSNNEFNFTLGVVNGEIGYTTYNNRYDIKTIPRMSVFTEYYNSTSDTAVYHPYIDANNDKVINAKDFAYIYNAGKKM